VLSLHVQQNRFFFPVDTNGMVRDVSAFNWHSHFLKPRKFIKKGEQNEIAEKLWPSSLTATARGFTIPSGFSADVEQPPMITHPALTLKHMEMFMRKSVCGFPKTLFQ
jgi:hypothetical protein